VKRSTALAAAFMLTASGSSLALWLFGHASVASAAPAATQLGEFNAAVSKSAVPVYYRYGARGVARRTTRRVIRRNY
jgi:hypothetical protein